MRAAHLWPENVIRSLGGREIKLVMLAAARIKQSAAMRAFIAACHVLANGHLLSANAAQHCGLIPFRLRPDLNRMARQRFVTFLTGVINAAALHPDGDDVESGSIVSAAGVCIEIDSANIGTRNFRARGRHR